MKQSAVISIGLILSSLIFVFFWPKNDHPEFKELEEEYKILKESHYEALEEAMELQHQKDSAINAANEFLSIADSAINIATLEEVELQRLKKRLDEKRNNRVVVTTDNEAINILSNHRFEADTVRK